MRVLADIALGGGVREVSTARGVAGRGEMREESVRVSVAQEQAGEGLGRE